MSNAIEAASTSFCSEVGDGVAGKVVAAEGTDGLISRAFVSLLSETGDTSAGGEIADAAIQCCSASASSIREVLISGHFPSSSKYSSSALAAEEVV